jgi:hypothetical protein
MGTGHQPEVIDPIVCAPSHQFMELLLFFQGQGDDVFADSRSVDGQPLAALIKQLFATYTALRFEGSSRVVDPCVDDLGVARRGLSADPVVALDN